MHNEIHRLRLHCIICIIPFHSLLTRSNTLALALFALLCNLSMAKSANIPPPNQLSLKHLNGKCHGTGYVLFHLGKMRQVVQIIGETLT